MNCLIVGPVGFPLVSIACAVMDIFPDLKKAESEIIGYTVPPKISDRYRFERLEGLFDKRPYEVAIFYSHHPIVASPWLIAIEALCSCFVSRQPECVTNYHYKDSHFLTERLMQLQKSCPNFHVHTSTSPEDVGHDLEREFKKSLLRQVGVHKLTTEKEMDQMCS